MLSFGSVSFRAAMVIACAVTASGTSSADDGAPGRQGSAKAHEIQMDVHVGQLKVNAQVMAAYKKTSWDNYAAASGGSAAASDLPPSDCPPEPVQVCRDSWKPKIINPFPGKDTKTINPFE